MKNKTINKKTNKEEIPLFLVYGVSSLEKNSPLEPYAAYPTSGMARVYSSNMGRESKIIEGIFIPKKTIKQSNKL